MEQIYLDHAAATPVDDKVLEAMKPYFSDKFFNPSAPYLPAVEVKNDYLNAKQVIAQSIGAKADQLIMTAGATEAINLAFNGHQSVLISGVEHPAIVNLAKTKQNYQLINIKPDGIVDLDDLKSKLNDQISIVAVSLVSSDLGTIQPISKISQLIKQVNQDRLSRGVGQLLLLVDAAQALGSININVGRLGADLLIISAAKIYGPKQAAALWVRPGVKVKPLIVGGGQEMGFRSGTENVPFVIGMARAIQLVAKNDTEKLANMRNQLEQYLLDKIPEAKVIGNLNKRLPNYLVISFGQIEAERLIYRLEELGIYVSTGAACSANKQTGSLALKQLGLTESEQKSSLRISLGRTNTVEQINRAKQLIAEQVLAEKERLND